MPWTTPTLRTVRETIRGEVTAVLGRASFIGNSVLRVMADAMAAMAHLTLRYLDWLALQFLPDTAEHEWLDRHGQIWLVNADGSVGRKTATYAFGTVTMTGTPGVAIPAATQLTNNTTTYETTEYATIGTVPVTVKVRALEPGVASNLDAGFVLDFVQDIPGVDGEAVVVELKGGVEAETDNQLRERVLRRIQQPPMGGAAHDYEAWALAVPGVTRAWCYPLEMGIGTVTVRFMCDDKRADNDGFPLEEDVKEVEISINSKRPVAVKDFFVEAPLKQEITCVIEELIPDTTGVRAEIEKSLNAMLRSLAAPGQTIFIAWKSYAIMNAVGVQSFRLVDDTDDVMESPGHMAVLGSVVYD